MVKSHKLIQRVRGSTAIYRGGCGLKTEKINPPAWNSKHNHGRKEKKERKKKMYVGVHMTKGKKGRG